MKIDLKSTVLARNWKSMVGDVEKGIGRLPSARDRSKSPQRPQRKPPPNTAFLSMSCLPNSKPVASKAMKKQKKSPGPKSKPKFRNPADPKQTWTGKGRQPNWFRAEVEKGTAPEAMAI